MVDCRLHTDCGDYVYCAGTKQVRWVLCLKMQCMADAVSLADVDACTCGPVFSGDLQPQLYNRMQL